MNSDPLDELLRSYSQQPSPAPAERLSSDVWRAIKLSRRQPFWSRMLPILSWRDVFAEPRLVAAALAVAFLVGMLPAALIGREASPRLARESLHFEVFSVVGPAIVEQLAAKPAGVSSPLGP